MAPVFLFIILTLLTGANLYVSENLERYKLNNSSYSFEISKYPVLQVSSSPAISANGAIIIDSNTKKILYEKNKDLRFSPASTTKIMTALTALEHFNPMDVLTVPQNSQVDSVIDLEKGGKFRLLDLLHSMMLPSDNRSADTIAQNFPGGREEFVKKMNENAREWSLSSTHFADPVGLLDDQNYTTPYDLSILASIAMENGIIKNVVSKKSETISDIEGKSIYELENLNILLGSEGVIGLKTGHTEQAGDVLTTAKKYDDNIIVIVVMNSEDRFEDTLSLLSFIKDRINYLSIRP